MTAQQPETDAYKPRRVVEVPKTARPKRPRWRRREAVTAGEGGRLTAQLWQHWPGAENS